MQTVLKKRDFYLRQLTAVQDTPYVKIITGIRRCGKSSLLRLMASHLREQGIADAQILEMNFESYEFSKMSTDDFYHYVRNRVSRGKRMYLFFDELSAIPEWEQTVKAFQVAFSCDIYITSSNESLFSAEFNTYLADACVRIGMFPLSFAEYVDFNGYRLPAVQGTHTQGGGQPQVTASRAGVHSAFAHSAAALRADTPVAGDRHSVLLSAFHAYMSYGGMPLPVSASTEEAQIAPFLDGIYSTIVLRDILEREKKRGQKPIQDPALLKKIILYLADTISAPVSVSSIGNALVGEGLFFEGSRENVPSAHTVQAYVNALCDSYFFCDIKRYDIALGEPLRTLGKFYIADLGLRNLLLGFRARDIGPALENVVCIELLRRGYEVHVGKLSARAVDFVAVKGDQRTYFQVTKSMTTDEMRKRELAPLKRIKDNYEKIVLSLEADANRMYDGIRSLSLIDWLLEVQET